MSTRGSPHLIDDCCERAQDKSRTLWGRVESSLNPQEVFTIRGLIGESRLDRNEGLWREIDALEDILVEAQTQNEELGKKLSLRRSSMLPTLERTFLESHLRLLLDKLESGDTPGERPESEPVNVTRDGELSTACQSHWPRTTEHGGNRKGRHSERVGCSGFSTDTRGPPSSCLVPYKTLEDRAIFHFLAAERGGSSCRQDEGIGTSGMEGREEGSRPQIGKMPITSRSARSAPECLEPSRCLSVSTIDSAIGDLRAAFDEEAQNLLEEVENLTQLLEEQVYRKAAAERQQRQSDTLVGSPIPSSELRRYGKKLEETVRSREHANAVFERLLSPLARPTACLPVVGAGDGTRKCSRREKVTIPPHIPLPIGASCSSGSKGSRRHSKNKERDMTSSHAVVSLDTIGESRETVPDIAQQGLSGGRSQRRSATASRLRGVVNHARYREALDDERFLS